MALVLDTGALIAFDRANRTVVAFIELAQRSQIPVRTTTGAVAQAWRSGSRQARLARLLGGTDERSLDRATARRVGELLAVSGQTDVVDATIVDASVAGDEVLTTDPDDLVSLANAAGKRLMIIPVST